MKNSSDSKPRGRPRQFDRDTALDQAMRIFWQRGYEATSISDLSAATGLNPPSLYAAFGDKERLFLESIDRYQSVHSAFSSEMLDAGPTARAGIQAALLGAAKSFTDPGCPNGCMVVLSAQNCGPEAQELQATLSAKRADTQAAFERRIRKGQKDGDIPKSSDTAALARFAMTVLAGMSVQARDGASARELAAVARQAAAAIPELHAGGPTPPLHAARRPG